MTRRSLPLLPSRLESRDPTLTRTRNAVHRVGPHALGDDELLALLLGRPAHGRPSIPWARKLLEATGGIGSMAVLPPTGLARLDGIGEVQGARLAAAFELGRRAAQQRSLVGPPRPMTASRVASWAAAHITTLDHEEVWVLCVDARGRLRSTWMVGRGGVHGCGLVARDILTPVVRDAASGFILVHNHPSGDPTPSREDIELTHGLSLAADAICVPLLDHVVVAREGHTSLFELELLTSGRAALHPNSQVATPASPDNHAVLPSSPSPRAVPDEGAALQ